MYRVTIAIFAAIAAAAIALPAKKSAPNEQKPAQRSGVLTAAAPWVAVNPRPPLPSRGPMALLVETHSDERIPLYDTSPSDSTLSVLLADRVVGEVVPIDPRLPALLRALAHHYPDSRIELVSGYRSARLNEAMRQSGRNVAMHSQHSLGNAVDFRIVPAGETRAVDPRTLEQEIRDLGWQGGIGVYPQTSDWFLHADVGPYRRWDGS